MPGNNKFKVSELWDGVKKSTADAWNEATQGLANILKQLQQVTTKHLPQIALVLRFVTTIPILIGNVRDIGKALPKGIEGVKALILKAIQGSISNTTKFIQGALRNTEKALRTAFNAAIKPLPKNIQAGIKSTLKPLLDGLKNSLKEAQKRVSSILNELTKLKTFFVTQLGKNRDAVLKGIKTPIDALGKLLKTDIAKIPKLFEAKVSGIVKAVQKMGTDAIKAVQKVGTDATKAVQKIPAEVEKGVVRSAKQVTKSTDEYIKLFGKTYTQLLNKSVIEINGNFGRALKRFDQALTSQYLALGKAAQDTTKVVQKIPADVEKGIARSATQVTKHADEAFKLFGKTYNELLVKSVIEINGNFGKALKRFDQEIASQFLALGKAAQDTTKVVTSKAEEATKAVSKVGEQVSQSVDEIKLLPKRAAEEVAKDIQVITKEVTKAGEVTAKTVGKSVDDVGKQVGKVAPYIDDLAKQFPKVASHLDDVLKLLGTVGKTVTSMLPIIEGIAEQINFEEIFQRLERIENRLDDNVWKDILENRVRIDAIKRSLDNQNGGTGKQADLQPILTKLDRIIAATGTPKSGTDNAALAAQLQALRTDIGAIPGKIQPANTTAIAEAVAAKIPKAQTDNAAIATAVAAKIPKPLDSAILTKTIQDAIKAAQPGQTVSSEAIAAAVAAKIPKPADNTAAIATAVKEKMGPQFKAIDAKLPDNGIFRVDQTGIANAVSAKLEKEKATVEPSNAAILKAINAIPGITKEQTAIITKAINDAKTPDKVAIDRLNQVVNLVNTHTTNNTKNIVNSVQNITVKSSPAIVNVPATDLSPIEAKLKDISNAIGVDGLKAGTPINAEAMVKAAGQQQFSNGQIQGVTTLAGMMAAVAAPAFYRGGLHRMGGTFDKSVMDPKAGKVKIEDAMAFQKWQFDQIDERMGMPTQMQLKDASGRIQPHTYRSIQDTVEEVSVTTVAALQDIEIVERYIVSLAQDMQKLMQICLQNRADLDVLIDDSGCKTKEERKSHPTHLRLTAPGVASSLANIFQGGEVHYVARVWADSADKNQKMERLSYDTQIAAMSNKFEFDKTSVELPLDKSRATDKPRNDEVWRTFVSTVQAPPEGYVTPGNPLPKIQEIKNGNPKDVPLPTDPLKKLGK